MALFGQKALEADIENLKRENAKLYVLGLKQAKEMKAEVEKLLAEIDALKLAQQNQALALEQEKNTYAQNVENAEAKLKEVQSESELLLLQLHQVQEELESVFLKEQEAQNQLQLLSQNINLANQDKFSLGEVKTNLEQEKNTLNETIATLIRDKGALNHEKNGLMEERDQFRKIAEEREAKINSLTQLVDGQYKEVQIQNERLEKNLIASQESFEALTQDKNKMGEDNVNLTQTILQLNEEKITLLAERDAQTQLNTNLQIQNHSMSQLIDGQYKEVQEENELLLLQLHQVQEELEHHFLESQKLQRENETAQTRWKRLEEREPQYLDYESILPMLVDTVSAKPRVDWLAKEITLNGEMVPQFLFTTWLDEGMPGIEITNSETQDPINPIRIVPRALVKPNAGKALAQYRNMTMQGWQALAAGIKAVEQFFKSPKKASLNQKLPDFFDLVFWRQSLMPLIADFKSLPAVFRFNEVKLKREQINPDYEHLWLEFDGASFGRYYWPSLEIRFGAANVQPGGFSRRPKVEIPKIGGTKAPFDSWFEESQDDFGPKMELRFDLNKQFFDLDVWSRVTAEDRAMLISVIGGIPFALKKMEDAAVKIIRPWEEWNLLASGMVDILRRIITEAEKLAKEAKDIKDEDATQTTKDVATNIKTEIVVGEQKENQAIEIKKPEAESVTTNHQAQVISPSSNASSRRFNKKKKR